MVGYSVVLLLNPNLSLLTPLTFLRRNIFNCVVTKKPIVLSEVTPLMVCVLEPNCSQAVGWLRSRCVSMSTDISKMRC